MPGPSAPQRSIVHLDDKPTVEPGLLEPGVMLENGITLYTVMATRGEVTLRIRRPGLAIMDHDGPMEVFLEDAYTRGKDEPTEAWVPVAIVLTTMRFVRPSDLSAT